MTQEFYHHFVSLLSIMKMKSSQCARHLTNVWETILTERLQTTSVPEDSRKIITLSKQTVQKKKLRIFFGKFKWVEIARRGAIALAFCTVATRSGIW